MRYGNAAIYIILMGLQRFSFICGVIVQQNIPLVQFSGGASIRRGPAVSEYRNICAEYEAALSEMQNRWNQVLL